MTLEQFVFLEVKPQILYSTNFSDIPVITQRSPMMNGGQTGSSSTLSLPEHYEGNALQNVTLMIYFQ